MANFMRGVVCIDGITNFFFNSLVHCTVALFVCLYCIVLCCIFCVSTLRVTLPSQIPCLCKLTWPIKPDSDSDSDKKQVGLMIKLEGTRKLKKGCNRGHKELRVIR